MKIGDILVQAGKITADQLNAALERQEMDSPRLKLGQHLVRLGWITSSDVRWALGRQFHLAVLPAIDEKMIDSSLIERIPVDWVRRHLLFPIREGDELVAVMADPSALPHLEELALLMGQELVGKLAPADEIKKAIDHAYFERKRDLAPAAPSDPDAPTAGTEPVTRADDLLRGSESAPVTQLVNGILLDAVRKKASDIHIEPYENHLRIRFRVDGFLYEQPAPPKHLEQALISRLKVMSRLDISERRLPQDGMAKVRAGDREVDIRVSTVPVAEGERVVLRLLNQSSTLMPLSELGMAEGTMHRFRAASALPHGILLVTGPTGSGKTTTLYAALREMDTVHRNVMTIEDPIEYQMANIGQIQVKPKIGLTFASGLRHILRQDPDVILVGEIRDQETAEIAVRSALTGHLVFSTLHTNDAVSAVVRLADMGIQPYLIASSVRAVLAQRLVRRLCPVCRIPMVISSSDTTGMPADERTSLEGTACFRPGHCDQCMQGYRGRVGLYELFSVGPEEQEAIRRGAGVGALRALSIHQGATMHHDALEKVRQGVTSLDEVRRVMEWPGQGPGA